MWDWSLFRRGAKPEDFAQDVFRYARTRLGSREDAEDVTAEVLLACSQLAARDDLKLYMIGIARRKVVDVVRRRRETVGLKDIPDDSGPRNDLDLPLLVENTLGNMLDDQREALILRFVVGLTSIETGAILARSPEAVDNLVQRAKAQFVLHWSALHHEEVQP